MENLDPAIGHAVLLAELGDWPLLAGISRTYFEKADQQEDSEDETPTPAVLGLAVFACSGDELITQTRTAEDENFEITTTRTGPERTESAVPASPSPTITATVFQLPGFDLDDYVNGDEIVELMAAVGEERSFPVELLDSAPELPEAAVQALVTEYLDDSRVVTVKQGFRDLQIETVIDYCDNGTRILQYFRDTRSAEAGENRVPEVGLVTLWSPEHTELTDWNQPYITGLEDHNRNAFMTRGWDALNFPRLIPPSENMQVRLGLERDRHVRVFDNPGCADPQPVLTHSPAQWSLLGLGPMLLFPDELRLDAPQLPADELVRAWNDVFSGIATFANLNGHPLAYYCGDHLGLVLDRNSALFGETFTWSIVDGSDVARNGVWIVYVYDNTNWNVRQEFMFLRDPAEVYRGVVAAELESCSIERGIQYADSIAPELEWLQGRPERPVG